MMTKIFRRAGAVIAIVAVCSCGAGEGEEAVRDNRLLGQLEPVVIIGENDGHARHVLHKVTSALRLGDGRIVVANAGDAEVLIFDSTGSLELTLGRAGSGPREFGFIEAVRPYGGDSLVVWDLGNRRLAYWALNGEFGRTERVPIDALDAQMVGELAGRGQFLILAHRSTRAAIRPWGTYADSVTLYRVGPASEVKPVGTYEGSWKVLADASEAGGPGKLRVPVPEGPASAVVVLKDSILIGHSSRRNLEVLAPNGANLGEIVLPITTRQRSSADAAAHVEAILRSVERNRRPALRSYYSKFPQLEEYPFYDQLIVDSLGRIWVRQYVAVSDTAAVWSILDNAGNLLASATLPRSFRLFGAGAGWVLGVSLDENDVESVVVLEVDV